MSAFPDAQYGTTASQSPPKHQTTAASVHQRTYQACIPCRQRKVRCDLGSVDNPHDPPCTRCRREAKECYFSATRRKKKGQSESNGSEAGDEAPYEIRQNRKRARTSVPAESANDDVDYDDPPRTPGGSIGRTAPLRRPAPPKPVEYGEEDVKAAQHTARILQQAEVHGGHDALKVLYQAAVHGRSDSTASSGVRPAFGPGITAGNLPPAASPDGLTRAESYTSYNNGPLGAVTSRDGTWKTPTDQPPTSSNGIFNATAHDRDVLSLAMKAWQRFRFVRAGWFTAKEGIDYILYFYKHLSPLTPVALPDFQHPSTHKTLLEEEPMLAVTILLIASRHMKLEGPGSHSRPNAIHHKLWQYLSGMIDRVVWGQEQFGGGFCGAGGPGAQPGADVNPLTRRGLRTLGSVESLVLLTEWHPRAMHFPPDEDDVDLMIPDEAWVPQMNVEDGVPRGIGGHRMDAWLEPCWRSDRMCWMLLGMAMSLAMEIGVFDSSEWQRHAFGPNGQPLSAAELSEYDKRRGNVRNLLLVYVTQTSGRLGLTSMLPGYYSKPEDSDLFRRQLGQQDSVHETTFHFWLRMAALMREGNNKIFANKTFTRDLIRNGNYKAALDQFAKPMNEWRAEFDGARSIPKHMRAVLEIEYEYCRCYLNALSLQAVAERCANDHPSPAQVLDPPLEMARSALEANGNKSDIAIAPTTLSKWLGGDRQYMLNVGDAARKLLKVVVDDLFPDGALRHAPVRTYFRIISVAIMLLKSFALGATESDITESLKLMDRTVEALRTCIVDDLHVASRFADLLDTLSSNLKPRLVRIAADGRLGRSRPHSNHNLDPAIAMSDNRSHVQQSPQAMAGAVQNNQQWNYTNNAMPPSSAMGDSPLFGISGISNDYHDLMGGDNNYSVMPPPGFNQSSPNTANGAGGNYDSYTTNGQFAGDWLALPLDPLLNMSGADVDQTMYGPQLGGHDMLEYLLASPEGSNGYA
ncbi:hypothetical protein BST61_g932 [Cercospora zeina]